MGLQQDLEYAITRSQQADFVGEFEEARRWRSAAEELRRQTSGYSVESVGGWCKCAKIDGHRETSQEYSIRIEYYTRDESKCRFCGGIIQHGRSIA